MMPDEIRTGAHPAQPPTPGNRWQEVSGIVDEALELPVEQRARFLARACPSEDLRMEVDRFLAACDRSGGFLDGAATTFAAPLLADAASPRAQDEAAALSLLRDALAGRYTIEHELGRGGMALVYLARDVRLHREVAVKLLRPEIAATLGAERFLREIETTARLTHPNILPLLDSGEAQGLLYFVMPFVTGETLRDRLDRDHRFTEAEAVRIAFEVADALEYTHRHDVLHRDLKPDNVLLANGRAVIADFGIACAINRAAVQSAHGSRSEPLTATGYSLGTPGYMSPEQAGGSRTLDGRSDIYALGCMLYEMLAGKPPFSGPTAAVIRQHLSAAAPVLAEIRPDIDPGITRAVARAMAKSPADRFATMHEFANALTAPATSYDRRSTAISEGDRALRRTTARRLMAVALLLTVAILAVIWIGFR